MKSIAVLLTVYNRRENTLRCLNDLHGQTIPSDYRLEVFLTNDGCTDGTPEAVRKEYPNVHIVKGSGTLFWNRGMIMAWQEAAKTDPDYYLWLNDDTYLKKNAISQLISKITTRNNNCIIVGSCHASNDEELITYGARDAHGKLIHPINRNGESVVTFNGNIVLIPRSVFAQLGTLDFQFHHSLGDFDYGLRATKMGIKIDMVDDIIGICDTHSSKPIWMDATKPLAKRWNHFFSPTGANPFEFFRYKYRHYGLLAACKSFISNYVHVLLPGLWGKN